MGLFSDLSSLGFENEDDIEVFKKKDLEMVGETEEIEDFEEKEKIPEEEDYLYEKNIECPCCGLDFDAPAIFASKMRPLGQGIDLRPKYEGIDPIKYEALVCPICGYASLATSFNDIDTMQVVKVQDKITPQFMGLETDGLVYSYDEAIVRYKMALLCDVVTEAKNSKKAYTCLKLAWVIRGKLESEGESLTEEQKKQLEADEDECLDNAYEGFSMANTSEDYPICGMEETTVEYLLSYLAYRKGKYKEAAKYIYPIIANKNISPTIKKLSVKLKDMIRNDYKAATNKQ
jgi:hypothetical protein